MKLPEFSPRSRAFLAVTALSFSLTPAWGQTETKPAASDPDPAVEPKEATAPAEVPLTTTGSVFSVDQDTFSITPAKVTVPLNFMYNSKTAFVDETEKTVPWDHMRAGLPVTVSYTTLGEKMLATKVVTTRHMIDGSKAVAPAGEDAQKREELADAKKRKDAETTQRAKTTPTAGGGTIMGFEQVIAVRPEGSSDVVQYVVNNSTHYVDTAGQPVALNLVRTGIPVSIQFVEDSGRKIATQLILQRTTSTPETKTGTTGSSGSSSGSGAVGARTAGNATGGGGTSYVGGLVPGALEDGFINPPITILPAALTPTAVNTTPTATGTQPSTSASGTTTNQTNSTGSVTPAQPSTRQPATKQPTNTQPAVRQPSNTQPAVRPPAVAPAPAAAPRAR